MYLDLIFDPMGAKKKLRIRKNKKIIAFWVNLNTKYQNQADSVRPNIVIFGSVFFLGSGSTTLVPACSFSHEQLIVCPRRKRERWSHKEKERYRERKNGQMEVIHGVQLIMR